MIGFGIGLVIRLHLALINLRVDYNLLLKDHLCLPAEYRSFGGLDAVACVGIEFHQTSFP